MSVERTLSIIKPDGVERQLVGAILSEFERQELRIVALKFQHLTIDEVKAFYAVHSQRPFFEELVSYVSRSPVVISVLAGEDAVARHRHIMGATNPSEADEGTIRKKYAKNIQENTVHGSDSIENARKEIAFFFADYELLS